MYRKQFSNDSDWLGNLKDDAYLFKGIFAPAYDYAGNVDLNKRY